MPRLEFVRGLTTRFKIIVTDVATGDPYDFDAAGATGIVAVLMDSKGLIFGRWSMITTGALATYDAMNIDDYAVGELVMELTEAKSKLAAPGKVFMELMWSVPNVASADGEDKFGMKKTEVGEMFGFALENVATH